MLAGLIALCLPLAGKLERVQYPQRPGLHCHAHMHRHSTLILLGYCRPDGQGAPRSPLHLWLDEAMEGPIRLLCSGVIPWWWWGVAWLPCCGYEPLLAVSSDREWGCW